MALPRRHLQQGVHPEVRTTLLSVQPSVMESMNTCCCWHAAQKPKGGAAAGRGRGDCHQRPRHTALGAAAAHCGPPDGLAPGHLGALPILSQTLSTFEESALKRRPVLKASVGPQVVWAVTNTQRHMDEYLEHQRKKSWCAWAWPNAPLLMACMCATSADVPCMADRSMLVQNVAWCTYATSGMN